MIEPYIGDIRLWAPNRVPDGWASCDGQLLPIDEYDTLYSLIGTTYGGDGVTLFAVPDLRGRVPISAGGVHVIGEVGGTESVTLTSQQLPVHSHPAVATQTTGTAANPAGNLLAAPAQAKPYKAAPPTTTLAGGSGSVAGASQPHDNTQPSLTVRYIISLYGIYPSQS